MTTRTAEHGSRVSARWRIVGWIVLTTALSLLAVMVTLRSVLLTQVSTQANHDIVQEVDEFSTFASEGVDPATAAPFTSATAMMERYLARQTPATGETLIAVTPTAAFFSDNAAADAGEILAGDRERLQEILAHPQNSGITSTPQGELRWGRTSADVAGESGTLVVGIFTEAARERVDRDTLLLLGVAAGGLLLTAGIAWLAAGQILRPIRDIARVADRIDALALSERVPVEGRDDIARLAVTFNDMLDRVERAHSSQRHFVSEVQHHLVEPRAEVERLLQTLGDESASERQRAAAVTDARHQLDRMATTLADLDLLSQHDRPDFVNPRPVDLHELTRAIVDLAVTRRPDRRWVLEEAPDATVIVDPERVTDAMVQLMRNAHAHTQPGEEIKVGASLEEGAEPLARFWVTNDGPPLLEDEARRLLEQYRSASQAGGVGDAGDSRGAGDSADAGDSGDAERTGMGLGLAVVRAVADAHGGSAWVESGEAEGTRFGIDLPFPAAQQADVADEHVEQLTTALRQEQ